MIKRIIILFAAVFMAVGTLFAQSESTGWKENVTGLDSLIKSNPSQAFERVEQLLKGKNKKNRKIQNFTSCDTVFSIPDSEGGAGGNGSAFRFRVQ